MSDPSKETLKLHAAQAALQFVVPGAILGVGSGSTVNVFVSLLEPIRSTIPGAVAASKSTEAALRTAGIPILDLNAVESIPVYVDGADEIDPDFSLIKGGGAALTREKIIPTASDTFVCIVDASKRVKQLGTFPLPIEVVPMAINSITRSIARMGGIATVRAGVVTDNGNLILDVRGLSFVDTALLESELNQLPGVVTNGIFAKRRADICICAGVDGVTVERRPAT